MDWHNPPKSWLEYEKKLREASSAAESFLPETFDETPSKTTENSLSSRLLSENKIRRDLIPYAELHMHSSFSFLDGVSSPEKLANTAKNLGLTAAAITDHNGLYGAARFAEAANSIRLPTIFGAELTLGSKHSRTDVKDPAGEHLLLLARGKEGYHSLSRVLTKAHLASMEKGTLQCDLNTLADEGENQWMVLTGCRKSPVRAPLPDHRVPSKTEQEQSEKALIALVENFGSENVVVELFNHQSPLDTVKNDFLSSLAKKLCLRTVVTGLVHYATPSEARLSQTMAAVRSRESLDKLHSWLPASPNAYLRSGREQIKRFPNHVDAVVRTVEIAKELSFSLEKIKPGLPQSLCPDGMTNIDYLKKLVACAIPHKYPKANRKTMERIERELRLIEQKDFAGYFLIIHDIVWFAKSRGILCQGRGSAANSAVCFLLGITAVDSIYYDLPFERFLSALRDEEPDIDVDFESRRREEVIQYVYDRYGRTQAAQVATVIEYKAKSAVRDVAHALGYSHGQQTAFTRQIDRTADLRNKSNSIPAEILPLALETMKLPRHLGIHPGGMVLTDRPVSEVVPVEPARMEKRTVLQWDKDDCEWMGLVKFDLLGLGILEAIKDTFEMARDSLGEHWELNTLPRDEQGVYDMLCRADSIGVFQVESRAQMALLPRLQPRRFYDLAIQIAMIRPGPIQGGAVHPFVRRKAGEESVQYLHPDLKSCLKRTLGVPIFQEQLMQIAMTVGGCTGEDADLLRRAMGSKRGLERIESLKETLYKGMKSHGLDEATSDRIYSTIQAFANFGFAESHSLSFALLVYSSAWLKLHYPAIFLAGLLRAWPMGFYSPASLVSDAERHGVTVRRPSVQYSDVYTSVEPISHKKASPTGLESCLNFQQPKPSSVFDPRKQDPTKFHRRDGELATRLGLASIKGIGVETASQIIEERNKHGIFIDANDCARRVDLKTRQLEALAEAGALEDLKLTRREGLWLAGYLARESPNRLSSTAEAPQLPLFPEISEYESMVLNRMLTGISAGDHPFRYLRSWLKNQGVCSIRETENYSSGQKVSLAGLVTHRQRPSTAQGITFLNLEDETGLINVICSRGFWKSKRAILRNAKALIIRGSLQKNEGSTGSIFADGAKIIDLPIPDPARNFN